MNVGFIGLGVMGSAMARHLSAGGHAVRLYDADAKQLARVAKRIPGATRAKSVRDVATNSDIVITMLPNGRVVQDVALGRDGLAAHMRRGSVLLDTSSAEPWLTRETAAALAERGIAMVDAPVSGAQEGAESASLVFMVGGTESNIARIRPLLDLMGRHAFRVGEIGAGHVMKSVNNLTTAITWLATAEAMLIGKAQGLSASAMIDVLNVSTGMNFITQRKMAQEVVSRRFADPFKLAFMVKDIGIATDLAQQADVPIPLSALGEQLWHAASKARGEGASITEIVQWAEILSGVELKDD